MSKETMQQALSLLYDSVSDRKGWCMRRERVVAALEAELAKPEQPDLRRAAEMALEALEKVTGGHAVVIHKLRQALAQPEQELDYPPECTTPELEVAYAAGWWKALEVQRNKQQALDKKADNARELGLDYEPEKKPVAWIYNGNLHIFDPSDWAIEPESVQPLYTAPPKREWVADDDEEFNAIAYRYRSWPSDDLKGVVERYGELVKYVQTKMRDKNE